MLGEKNYKPQTAHPRKKHENKQRNCIKDDKLHGDLIIMTPGYIAIVGAISTVFAGFGGAALGAWFASKTGIKLIFETNRSAAAARLHRAFAPAKAKIITEYYADGRKLRDFFYEELSVHASAVEEFRPFASDGSVYQKAWEDYQQTINHERGTNNEEYLWTSNVMETEKGIHPLSFNGVIMDKIGKILHFANL